MTQKRGFPRRFSSGFSTDSFPVVPGGFRRRFSGGFPAVSRRFLAGFANGFPAVRHRFSDSFSSGLRPSTTVLPTVFQRFSPVFHGFSRRPLSSDFTNGFPAVRRPLSSDFTNGFPAVRRRFSSRFASGFPGRGLTPVFRVLPAVSGGSTTVFQLVSQRFSSQFCPASGSTTVFRQFFQRFSSSFANGFPAVFSDSFASGLRPLNAVLRFSSGFPAVFRRFSGGSTAVFRQHASPGSTPVRLRRTDQRYAHAGPVVTAKM